MEVSKTTPYNLASTSLTKDQICQSIDDLHQQVNQLALQLSTCCDEEISQMWSNLANARAYLNTALAQARALKNSSFVSNDWQI